MCQFRIVYFKNAKKFSPQSKVTLRLAPITNQPSEDIYVKKSQANEENDDDWRETIEKPPADLRPKTEDVTATRGLEWDDFCLRKEVLMGIVGNGFDKPSPVQEEVIPIILASNFQRILAYF